MLPSKMPAAIQAWGLPSSREGLRAGQNITHFHKIITILKKNTVMLSLNWDQLQGNGEHGTSSPLPPDQMPFLALIGSASAGEVTLLAK